MIMKKRAIRLEREVDIAVAWFGSVKYFLL